MKKKVLISFCIILLLLIVTNPTNDDFKDYIKANEFENKKDLLLGRIAYLGVFSVFQINNLNFWKGPEKYKTYVGIFKNFIQVSGQKGE